MSQTKAQLVSGTTAQDLTVDNINTTSINSGQASGRKNLIINGAMQVAQRGTSSTSQGYQTVDRFHVNYSGTNESPTQAQVDLSSSDTPYSLGFRKALKITNGNQSGGAGSSDYIEIGHKTESQDIAKSGWNYTNTNSKITLSFWVKSSVAQVFYGYMFNRDGTRTAYAFSTGSLSQNTWTKITKTIIGNSALQFDNNNEAGLEIYFTLFMGTDLTDNSRSLNSWATFDGAAHTPDQTSTWYTTDDATFEITGIQLEVGSTATDFEHRSVGQELALCQRYFEKTYAQEIALGNASNFNGAYSARDGTASSVVRYYPFNYKTTKRATPTVTIYNPSTGATASLRLDSGSYSGAVSSPNDTSCMIFSNDGSPPSHYGAFFHLALEAEL